MDKQDVIAKLKEVAYLTGSQAIFEEKWKNAHDHDFVIRAEDPRSGELIIFLEKAGFRSRYDGALPYEMRLHSLYMNIEVMFLTDEDFNEVRAATKGMQHLVKVLFNHPDIMKEKDVRCRVFEALRAAYEMGGDVPERLDYSFRVKNLYLNH